MRFYVSIPGQPVSADKIYRTGNVTIRDRSGGSRMIRRPVLTEEGRLYREAVQTLVQLAKPSRFRPEGQIRITIDLFLARDIDDDNTLKLLYDGVAPALGMNDAMFLHCVRSKVSGLSVQDAHVDLMIDTDPIHP